jgi:hypothetical protein
MLLCQLGGALHEGRLIGKNAKPQHLKVNPLKPGS